jgi:phosphopantetheine--protein transferase-like protein
MVESNAAVVKHFAETTCEVDPPVCAMAASFTVLFAPFVESDAVTAACEAVLSEGERERARRLATPEVHRRFVQRRAFRRYAAARALGSSGPLVMHEFAAEPKGRPFLPAAPEVSWSVSSCRAGMLAAWTRGADIGVDLEDRARQVECLSLAKRYFDPAEARLVVAATPSDRMVTFLRFWCLKEAVLKAIGEGIAYGLEKFVFSLEPDVRLVQAPQEQGGASRFSVWELVGDQLEAARVAGAVVLRMPVLPARQSLSAEP